MKSCTNFFVLLEEQVVEHIGKGNCRLIFHLVLLLDTDDMLGTRLLKDCTNFLRVARCHEDELKLDFVLPDHFLKLVAAD